MQHATWPLDPALRYGFVVLANAHSIRVIACVIDSVGVWPIESSHSMTVRLMSCDEPGHTSRQGFTSPSRKLLRSSVSCCVIMFLSIPVDSEAYALGALADF